MIKQIFLIFILTCSITFANDRLRGYQALEQKDYKTALYYLSYDANLGDDLAQYNLGIMYNNCLLYTSPSPRDKRQSRMPSSA